MIIFSVRPYLNLQGNTASSSCADRISTKNLRDSETFCKSPHNFSEQNTFLHKCWDGLFYFGAIGEARNPNPKSLLGQYIKLQIHDTPCQKLLHNTKYRTLMRTEKKIIYYQFIFAYEVMSLSVSCFWAGTLFIFFFRIFCYSSLRVPESSTTTQSFWLTSWIFHQGLFPLSFFLSFLNQLSSSRYSNNGYC